MIIVFSVVFQVLIEYRNFRFCCSLHSQLLVAVVVVVIAFIVLVVVFVVVIFFVDVIVVVFVDVVAFVVVIAIFVVVVVFVVVFVVFLYECFIYKTFALSFSTLDCPENVNCRHFSSNKTKIFVRADKLRVMPNIFPEYTTAM